MRRALASRAEVFRRRHQALSEILLPDAIDDDARGQWIVLVHYPFRQAEPVWRSVFRERMKRGGNAGAVRVAGALPIAPATRSRSEEHTSELQSLRHLVCRLLLEKKKINGATTRHAK